MNFPYVPFAAALALIVVGQALQLFLLSQFKTYVKDVSKNTTTHKYKIPAKLSAGTLVRRFSRDYDGLQSVAVALTMGSSVIAFIPSTSFLFGAAFVVAALFPLLTFVLVLSVDVDNYDRMSPFSISPIFILGAVVNAVFFIVALIS